LHTTTTTLIVVVVTPDLKYTHCTAEIFVVAHNYNKADCCSCCAREPDYYKVIDEPVDLNTIEQNITSHRYRTLSALDEDFVHLFTSVEVGCIPVLITETFISNMFVFVFVDVDSKSLCLQCSNITAG